MLCSCEFFRCRPRSNHIWAPFSVRKVHPDFHGGYTSLQTYRPDTNFIITVSASHTGINCDPSPTASQVGVNCTMSVLYFYFKTRCSRTHYIHHTGLRLTGIHLPIALKCCDYWCEVCMTTMSQTLWACAFPEHCLLRWTLSGQRDGSAGKTPDAKPDDQGLILSTHIVWENQFQQTVLQQINKLKKISDFRNICNVTFLSLYYISFMSTSHEVFLLKICQQIVDNKNRTKF